MKVPAALATVGAGVLIADTLTSASPDLAIIGVAFVLAGIAGVVLTILLPAEVVPPRPQPSHPPAPTDSGQVASRSGSSTRMRPRRSSTVPR